MERDPQASGEQWLPPQPPGAPPAGEGRQRDDTPTSTPQPGEPPPAQAETSAAPQNVQGYGFVPGYGPPAWQQPGPYGYGAYGQPPPAYGQPPYPPPGYAQQPWGQPHGYPPAPWGGQQWPQQTYAERQPNNDPAIAGLSLSLCGLGLLFLSVGLSAFLVSPAAGAFGIWFGRRGMQKVDRGETPRYRSAGKAGVVLGIITLVLSLIALAIWIAVIASDPEFFEDPEREDAGGAGSAAAGAALVARLAASLAA